MAGHFDRGDVIIDTHEGPIIDPVWDLYRFTIEAIGRPVSTLIEWDTNVPALGKVVDEAQKAEIIIEELGLIGKPSPNPLPQGRGPTAVVLPPSGGRWPEGPEEGLSEPVRSPLAERREAVGVR
jgi:hypothetical protein